MQTMMTLYKILNLSNMHWNSVKLLNVLWNSIEGIYHNKGKSFQIIYSHDLITKMIRLFCLIHFAQMFAGKMP